MKNDAMEQKNGGLLVIKASAGSGKTYSLTKLYIEQLLLRPTATDGKLELRRRPDYHRHILAITFTNKATDEMKHRIVKELYQLSQDVSKSDYCDYFRQRCTPEAFDGLRQAAADALNSILMNYSTFMVSTIDSFFQTILRSFARELDRDYNYEVQIDEKYAVKVAVRNFLLSLGRDRMRAGKSLAVATALERWVSDFIRSNADQSGSWTFLLTKKLPKFAEEINTELFRTRLGHIRAYLSRDDENGARVTDLSRIQQFLKMLVMARNYYDQRYRNEFGGQLETLLQRHGLAPDAIKNALKSFVLENKMQNDAEPAAALRGIDADGVQGMFKVAERPSMDAVDEIVLLVRDITQTYYRRSLLQSMIDNLGLLGLLGIIDEKLEDYRKETNSILIGDTNELISHLVAGAKRPDSTTIPFIYERVGTWINHYMIDEFQDTSHKQYDNFLPLLFESLSNGTDNFNMVIGDAKQSIYRFRNADPSLFRDAINRDFKDYQLRTDNLPTNYRSLPAVIDFNNEFFRRLIDHYAPESNTGMVADVVRRTYMPSGQLDDFQQRKHKSEPAGFVRIIPYTDCKVKECAQVVVDNLPAYLLQLHERYAWKQIGILVSRNEEGVDVVSRLLEHNLTADPGEQIGVTSDESMLLNNAPTVRRIISMLRFVDLVQYMPREEDELSEEDEQRLNASIKSRSNKKRLSAQRISHALGRFIAALAEAGDVDEQMAGELLEQSFADVPDERTRPLDELMAEYEQELLQLLPDPSTNLLSLVTIVEHILGRIMDNSSRADTAFLLGFQTCVNQFSAMSPGGTVREFLQYWDQRKDKLSVASTSTGDAVTVMTIHKSKGLEFDCVVVPFANWEMNTNSQEKLYWMPQQFWNENDCGRALFDGVPDVTYDESLIPPLLPVRPKALVTLNKCDGSFDGYVGEQLSSTLIDNLNKTYVAFTRAGEELHVFAHSVQPKTSGNEHIGALLGRLLDESIPGMTKTPEGYFEMGEPRQDRKPEKDTDQQTVVIDMPPYYVSPLPGKVNVKLPREVTARRREGLRMHSVLGMINYRRDARRAINYARYHGIIGTPDGEWSVAEVEWQLEQLFTRSETAPWFADDNQVYTERSMFTVDDREMKRPDRVVRRADGTLIVIDYKTGVQRKKDYNQVADYMARLRHMGNDRVQGYLLYLDAGKPFRIVPVTDENKITN